MSEEEKHSKLALMKKGLRLLAEALPMRRDPFKTCPDEEGIKTSLPQRALKFGRYSKLALMKKGLRLLYTSHYETGLEIQNLP